MKRFCNILFSIVLLFTIILSTSCNNNASDSESDSIMLSAPTMVHAIAHVFDVYLSWEPVSNATEYIICYGRDNNCLNEANIKIYTASNSITLSGLNSETTYYFWVKAIDSYDNESEYSEVVSATTEKFSLPVPTGLQAEVDGTTISLYWESVSSIAQYVVQYIIRYGCKNSCFDEANIETYTASNSITLSGLSSETTYYFWVKAIDSYDNESEYSEVVSATTERFYLSTPSVWVTKEDTTSISLAWDTVKGATRYLIYKSNDSTVENAVLSTSTTSTSTTISGLKSKTSYYFWVQAENRAKDCLSDYSGCVLATTLSGPTYLNIVNNSSYTISPVFCLYTAAEVASGTTNPKASLYSLNTSNYSTDIRPGQSYLWMSAIPGTYVRITSHNLFAIDPWVNYIISVDRDIVIKQGETTTLIITDSDFYRFR